MAPDNRRSTGAVGCGGDADAVEFSTEPSAGTTAFNDGTVALIGGGRSDGDSRSEGVDETVDARAASSQLPGVKVQMAREGLN